MTEILTIFTALFSFLVGWFLSYTFYVVSATGVVRTFVKIGSVFYLSMINKGIEHLYYAQTNKLEALRKNGKSHGHEEHESAKIENEKLISLYKENSIKYLINLHPTAFGEFLEFNDWRGAQRFLKENKLLAFMVSKEKD